MSMCVTALLLLIVHTNARVIDVTATAAASPAMAKEEQGKAVCQEIPAEFNYCFAEYGYTTTSLPNAYNQVNIILARNAARAFNASFATSTCASRHELNEFICVTYFPPCVDGQEYAQLKGCQDWCTSLSSRCAAELTGNLPGTNRPLTWPSCEPTGDFCWPYESCKYASLCVAITHMPLTQLHDITSASGSTLCIWVLGG